MKKPQCSRCGRALSDPYSIAVGMGPECRGAAKKRGVRFPKAKWSVQGGRVVFDGLQKQVEPLNANDGGRRKDEKRELVLRIKRDNGNILTAVKALHDYLREKDSPMPRRWCENFVLKIWMEEA